MARHLVARAVEARRVVRRPLGVGERHLVGRVGRTHVEWEAHLQQLVLLVPVDGRMELDPPSVRVEPHDLAQRAALADPALERDLSAQRPVRRDRPRVGGRAVAARLEVGRVDVPGVEVHRQVLVELEPVAGRRQRLAARRLVDDAFDVAVLAESHSQIRVLQYQPVDSDYIARFYDPAGRVRLRFDDDKLAGRIISDLVSGDSDRVDRRFACADQRFEGRLELGEVAACVVVHEPDRRAGEDVVELLQQQELPEPVELGAWIVAARGRQELGIVQQLLAHAVAALREGLRRVHAAVVLEVELADDHGTVGVLSFQRFEELVARRLPRAREALQVARASQRFEHRARRAAAAVAVPVDEQARPARLVILELAIGVEQLLDACVAVVRVDGREVAEHFTAVDPLPRERVRVWTVEAVPRELLRQEPRHAGEAQQLR